MAITIDLPPQMAEEAKGYATLQGTTLEQMFLQLLKNEMDRMRRRETAKVVMRELDELVERTSRRLKGAPYKFNRADAYEPETPYA